MRDNYGITQCIIDKENKNFSELEKTQLETVIKVSGKVVNRSDDTKNKDIETGEIEIAISDYETLGTCKELPMPVFSDQEYAEEIRLKYRFLDLRRKKIHENIILRSKGSRYTNVSRLGSFTSIIRFNSELDEAQILEVIKENCEYVRLKRFTNTSTRETEICLSLIASDISKILSIKEILEIGNNFNKKFVE